MNATARALFGAAFGCFVFCATAVNAQTGLPPQGQPVTAKDIVGKKNLLERRSLGSLCRQRRFLKRSTPQTPQQMVGPRAGPHQDGVGYRQAQILPNGQFFSAHFCGGCGSITGQGAQWGTVCN
jgi:hypothetical protein